MAGKNEEEVYVGVDGIVSSGTDAAVAPTTAESTLGTGWADLGYVSDQGVDETVNQTSNPLRAWQKNKKVRTLVEDGDVAYHFVLLQTSADTVAFYYGGTVDDADGSIVVDPTVERPTFKFNLDVIDGDNRVRAYAPNAQVTEVGQQVYRNGEPVGYEVTVTCTYDETLGGSVKKFYSALVVAP
jgi:hypothetical protein